MQRSWELLVTRFEVSILNKNVSNEIKNISIGENQFSPQDIVERGKSKKRKIAFDTLIIGFNQKIKKA